MSLKWKVSSIDDEYYWKCVVDEHPRVTREEKCQRTPAMWTLNIDAGEEDEQALLRLQCYREDITDYVLSQCAESQCLDVSELFRKKEGSRGPNASRAAPLQKSPPGGCALIQAGETHALVTRSHAGGVLLVCNLRVFVHVFLPKPKP